MDWLTFMILVVGPIGLAIIIGLLIVIAYSRNQKRNSLGELKTSMTYDIVDLHECGYVGVRATGDSITRLNAEIQNRTKVPVNVVIRRGTAFPNETPCQSMVVTKEKQLCLDVKTSVQTWLEVACLNPEAPIPKSTDRFRSVIKVGDDLIRFLDKAQNEDPMVIQAGVWGVQAGYSAGQILGALRLGTPTGLVDLRPSAISRDKIARAKKILDELGIVNKMGKL